MPKLKKQYPYYLAGRPLQPNADLEVREPDDDLAIAHASRR